MTLMLYARDREMVDEWNARCVALVATADRSNDLVSNIGHLALALSSRTEPPPNYFVQYTRHKE